MGKEGFESLKVWKKAKELAVLIYQTTEKGSFARDYGLRDQIRRSAVSIASNIAEGDERGTDKEAVRFFFIAKGSLAELRTQLIISHEIGYIQQDVYQKLDHDYKILARQIGSLIKARKAS